MTTQFAERTVSGWRLYCEQCKTPCDHVTPEEMASIVSSHWPTYCLECYQPIEGHLSPLERDLDTRPFWLTIVNPTTGKVDITVLVNPNDPTLAVVVEIVAQTNLRELQEAMETAVINGVVGEWPKGDTVYLVAHNSKDGKHNGRA